jgi:hypothetical protein
MVRDKSASLVSLEAPGAVAMIVSPPCLAFQLFPTGCFDLRPVAPDPSTLVGESSFQTTVAAYSGIGNQVILNNISMTRESKKNEKQPKKLIK